MFQTPVRRTGHRAVVAIGAVMILCVAHSDKSGADDLSDRPAQQANWSSASKASPIYGITIPAGYRDWKLISVSRLDGRLSQLRAQFGNDIAVKAMKDGTVPFPDGSIIAAVHWNNEAAGANDEVLVLLGSNSFVPGAPVNVQFMVKDSKKYASTGGWGFADFKDGKPGDEVLHNTCFACHQPAIAHDYVFTHYAPAP